MKSLVFSVFLVSFALILSPLNVQATIISTEVGAGMETGYYTWYDYSNYSAYRDSFDTGFGQAYASVNVTGNVTGASAHSTLELIELSDESLNLLVDIGIDGNDWQNGFLRGYNTGSGTSRSNYLRVNYYADVNTSLSIAWDYLYSGVYSTSGLGGTWIMEGAADGIGGSILYEYWDYRNNPHAQGSMTYDLYAGNSYWFWVGFNPNVAGNLSLIEGQLTGNISFNFAGAAPVPEPSTVILLTTGFIGLVGYRRKRSG